MYCSEQHSLSVLCGLTAAVEPAGVDIAFVCDTHCGVPAVLAACNAVQGIMHAVDILRYTS